MTNLQDLMIYKALTHKTEDPVSSGDMTKEVFDPTSEVEAAGGISNFVKLFSGIAFVINLTENSSDSTYTSDKTYEQINSAYQSHRILLVQVNSTAIFPLLNAEFNGNSAGFTFGYTQVRADGSMISTRSIHYLHTPTQDVWSDSDMSSEPLLLSGGVMDGTLNMGANMIINIQKLHVNGEAPIFIGSTIEPVGTLGVRITGTTDNEAAVVSPSSHSTYKPIRVGPPTKNEHAVPKSFMEDKLDSKLNKTTAQPGQLKVYCVSGEAQDVCLVSNSGLQHSIARYDAFGQIVLGSNPSKPKHAATMEYVDNKTKISRVEEDFSIGGDLSVAGRAYILSEPINDVDAVNKGYLRKVFQYDASTKTLDIVI